MRNIEMGSHYMKVHRTEEMCKKFAHSNNIHFCDLPEFFTNVHIKS